MFILVEVENYLKKGCINENISTFKSVTVISNTKPP